MMIPEPTEADLARDAETDYAELADVTRHFDDIGTVRDQALPWIRRAVAAEANFVKWINLVESIIDVGEKAEMWKEFKRLLTENANLAEYGAKIRTPTRH